MRKKNLAFILSTFLSVTAHSSAFSAGWEATSIWLGNCYPRFSCLVIPQESDTAQKHRRTVLRKKTPLQPQVLCSREAKNKEKLVTGKCYLVLTVGKKTNLYKTNIPLIRAIWKHSLLHPTNNMKRILQTHKQLPDSAVNIDWWKSLEKQGVI